MSTAILIICYLNKYVGLRILQVSLDRIWPPTAIYLPARDHILITIISTDKSPLKINFVDEICGPRCVQYKTPALHSFHLHKSPHMFLSLPGSHVTQVYFWLQGGCASVSGAGPRNPPHNTSCDEQSTDEKRKQTETVIMRSTHKITRPSIKLW